MDSTTIIGTKEQLVHDWMESCTLIGWQTFASWMRSRHPNIHTTADMLACADEVLEAVLVVYTEQAATIQRLEAELEARCKEAYNATVYAERVDSENAELRATVRQMSAWNQPTQGRS